MDGEDSQRLILLVWTSFFALEWLSWEISQWLQQQPWFQRWVTELRRVLISKVVSEVGFELTALKSEGVYSR